MYRPVGEVGGEGQGARVPLYNLRYLLCFVNQQTSFQKTDENSTNEYSTVI